MISIVLFRPETAGNVGAIARLMSNFNCTKLVIVDPQCDAHSKEALDRAKHAKGILLKAEIAEDKTILEKFDYAVATTAMLGNDYNIPRSPLTPRQLAAKIGEAGSRKIAIVFGPEGQGLSNQEILACDFAVTIPSSTAQPTLNLSHAAGIILYEIFLSSKNPKQGEHIAPISKKEKDHLLEVINQTASKLTFRTLNERETQRRVWKKLIGKSMLTRREAYALFGFFRRI